MVVFAVEFCSRWPIFGVSCCFVAVQELLSVDKEEIEPDSMFFQIQCIMAYLMESKKQYYSPEKFWSSFKLFGEAINVREQQDAFEFFNSLTDQLDEELKVCV